MLSLAHLTDAHLLRNLTALVHQERANTATLLAHLAEVDARRLYLPAGYSSMHVFCVEHLRFSDDAAYRRIRAARAARQFPALFAAVSDGRLNLAAVSLLAPHLTYENVAALIEAATHKRKIEVEELLAERFASSGAPPCQVTRIRVIPALPSDPPAVPLPLLAAAEADEAPQLPIAASTSVELRNEELVLGRVGGEQVPAAPRFHFQFVVPKTTHDKLRHAQALLSHSVPTGDLARVIDRALDALISQLEVRKLGVGARDLHREDVRREGPVSDRVSRYIPAAVRRAAWERDGGRCTFVSITGGRCRSRQFLEFDHVEPFARGGKATVDNIRLRCRAHNQFEAEQVFGREFMRQRRQEARLAAAEDRDGGAGFDGVAGPE
jgi:5-methylcytosine-specific restriction endonuclease McrA